MKRVQKQVSQPSGFTLIEVLIAITLFSLITVLLASSFHLVDKSRTASLAKVDEMETVRQAQQLFKQYLETAQPVWLQRDSERRLLFSGTAHELTFVSVMPAYLGDAGLYEIRLQVTGEASNKKLKFDRQLLHPDLFDTADEQQQADTVLLEHHELKFSYFGRTDENEAKDWHEEWPSIDHLPDLVQLMIRDEAGHIKYLKIRMVVRLSGLTPVIENYQPKFQVLQGG